MTIDVNRAHDIDHGLLINDPNSGNNLLGPFFTGGPNEPIGLNLPESTVYVQNKDDGILIWRKFGNDVSDWCIHDGLYRRGNYRHVFTIPAGNTFQYQSNVFDKELLIDGEGYVL